MIGRLVAGKSWGVKRAARGFSPAPSGAIAPGRAGRQNGCVPAEQIIALEAALTDLSDLYSIARGFTALQTRAEAELLPQINAMGSRLRKLMRSGQLNEATIDQTAREMLGCATLWRSELEGVRHLPVYQQAVRAVSDNRQAELGDVIPRVFARLRVVRPAPALYFGVAASSGRRRPGASPFLSPKDCADKILHLLSDGIAADVGAAEWWERELPSITCVESPAGLESPIALRLAAADVHVTLFAEPDAATLRVFATHLRAPLSVVLAREVADEWWEAYQDSYQVFRDALQQQLVGRGQTVTIAG
jgi:hypothetical protein